MRMRHNQRSRWRGGLLDYLLAEGDGTDVCGKFIEYLGLLVGGSILRTEHDFAGRGTDSKGAELGRNEAGIRREEGCEFLGESGR